MTYHRQGRLLLLAAIFLFLYSLILTLSPAVRERSWNVSYRLSHWAGLGIWGGLAYLTHLWTLRNRREQDPLLLPIALMLGGWGLLSIWRIDSALGLRQAIWLGISLGALLTILHLPQDLRYLCRYKYLLLGGGLLLSALTLLLGTNPAGAGPRLWLGCCGFYFQPSEPLKLLLVVYLSAYLADRAPVRLNALAFLFPTLFITALSLLLLLVQRDLGTASLFIMIYMSILYLASGKRRVLLSAAIGLGLAALVGYFFVDIIHVRLESWLNPWNDPSGRAYQVIQSLLAIASGGTIGRGPGLGYPNLVPVAYSDFIFAAMAEETGLAGSLGLLGLFGLMFARGVVLSLRAPDAFRRLLASGLTAYLGIQTLLIVGGNLRMLPITGVTLPFVSYGGSSLLTSFVALGFLLVVSTPLETEPAPLESPRPYLVLAALLGAGLAGASLLNGWWGYVRGPALLARTDNPRRSMADLYVRRGQLLDRNNSPIDVTRGSLGSYTRVYLYPGLAPLTGYVHPRYGQAGLEATLDEYLRGTKGNPASLIWWNHLLYGMPPAGLDVRLSLDLTLQKQAERLFGNLKGALVLLNAQTGEILVMLSKPAYDPNKLDESGVSLIEDKDSPLLNRAAQGMYPVGAAFRPFYAAWGTSTLDEEKAMALFRKLGFYTTPRLPMPVATAAAEGALTNLRISPLQMVLAAASLSNNGTRPAPVIALAINTPHQGWVVLPPLDQPTSVFSAEAARRAALQFSTAGQPYWEWSGKAGSTAGMVTWHLAGTPPDWKGVPLAVVVLVEGDYPLTAQRIGEQVLQSAAGP